ncbi:MAG: aminotransferase class I/II-fold pyridoxal phosphate-dependent enzyme [Mesorhizobium sp.]|nr:MAG: aminotransferase class I/II-fold pyridoxal phosphate-dependent enzyme [Mesorhizobium sp.]
MTLIENLRAEARAAPESGIVAVMNRGRDRDGMIPLWAGEGDLPTPAFITDAAARALAGGETFYTAGVAGAVPVAVTLDQSGNGWSCDIGKIEAAITPRTKALFVNTPSNPTGWTADRQTLQAILDLARERGLWIIADEIYSLFHYGDSRAPSFIDIMADEDRILFVNSFSKNWSMTGWRVGWIKVHPCLQQVFENLVQYSTSGVAQFMQRGAVVALDEGDAFIVEQVERARAARDLVCGILAATGRARFTVPQGAFYLFFAVDGITDSRAAAFDIVDRANVGLAPGTAFGPGGEAFLRLCFHRRLDQLEEAAHRLAKWMKSV